MDLYWIGTGGNTSDSSNWSLISGGAGGAGVPTSADDVFFDASSGDATVDVQLDCLVFNCTGYSETFTMTSNIFPRGNITLSNTMGDNIGNGQLLTGLNVTLTSNGKAWTNLRVGTTNSTLTFIDDWTIDNLTTNTNSILTINGNNVYINQNFTIQNGGGNCTWNGTTHFHMVGTGNFTGSVSVITPPTMNCLLTVNTSGTITFLDSFIIRKNFTIVTGTVIATACDLVIFGTINLDLLNNEFRALYVRSGTYNLVSNITTNLLQGAGNAFLILNNSTLYIKGNIVGVTSLGFSGTTAFQYIGTGTWTSSGAYIANNLTINTAGTFTISGTVSYQTGTLTYVAGTVVTTGSTLNISAACTLNTSGMSWNNVTITNAGIRTLSSLLTISNTLTYAGTGTLTFAGTAGFKTANLVCTVPNKTITYVSTNTYTVTNSLTLIGNSTQKITFNCNVIAGTKANFVLNYGATQNVVHTNATDIDSSAGQTIHTTLDSTLTRTINWNLSEGNWWLLLKTYI
jgi:hypothetical protein